jgi:ASC-1-like (ASCH) protein
MEIPISNPYFYLIKSGKKVVEGKKISPKWEKLKVGDNIKFTNGLESFDAVVLGITKYTGGENNLRDYLIGETLDRTLPGVNSIDAAEMIYMSPPISWTPEEIKKYGVMAILVNPK